MSELFEIIDQMVTQFPDLKDSRREKISVLTHSTRLERGRRNSADLTKSIHSDGSKLGSLLKQNPAIFESLRTILKVIYDILKDMLFSE